LERWESVLAQLTSSGAFELTEPELDFSVKMAWRNATRCSARIQWNKLVK
jgi:nitric oxide synthase oxygenase domain/subunit